MLVKIIIIIMHIILYTYKKKQQKQVKINEQNNDLYNYSKCTEQYYNHASMYTVHVLLLLYI